MPLYKTTGLVIKRTNLGEADRIITLITKDYGKLRAIARGVRKINSKQAGHLEIFSITQLMLAKGKNLDVITSARLKLYFDNILDNYQKLSLAYLFIEMIDKLTVEENPQSQLYRLIVGALRYLNKNSATSLLELYFKLKLIDTLGYRPELKNCVICHKKIEHKQIYYFNCEHGGVVHGDCKDQGDLTTSWAEVKLWEHIFQASSIKLIAKIKDVNKIAESSLMIYENFYKEVFNYNFKSRKILQTS